MEFALLVALLAWAILIASAGPEILDHIATRIVAWRNRKEER